MNPPAEADAADRKAWKKRPGRAGPKPIKLTRKQVVLYAELRATGASEDVLARALGLSRSTLRRRILLGELKASPRLDGAKPRVWTPEERALVGLVAGIGHHPNGAIAAMLGISVAEFSDAFREELLTAKYQIDAKIGATIVERAIAGDATLLKFYARAKMGWRDVQGAGANPAGDKRQAEADLMRRTIAALDEDGRAAYRIVLRQLGAASPLNDGVGPGPEDRIQ